MRHIRLTGHNLRKLTNFKAQIGEILNELNKFDEKESNKQNNNNKEAGTSTTEKCLPKTRKKQRLKFINQVQNTNVLPKKSIFKCKACDFTEKTRKLMFKHVQKHVDAPLSCIKCRKTFHGSVSFNWHLSYYCTPRYNKQLKYKCNLCPRQFVTKRTLQSHLQGHKRNNCAYCDKVLTRRVELIRHLLAEHSIRLECDTHKCDYCEKRYIKRRSLYYHSQEHFPDKFVCLECGSVTDTREGFEEHKRQHDLEKPFSCYKCGDKFSRRQQYLFHLKRHDRYKCVTCNETYASRMKTVKHKQQGHEVEGLGARFYCRHCSMAFTRESRFNIHLRKHTEENRSVNCKYCKKNFNSPYAYYRHCITINHEKCSPETNDIVCSKCGKHFSKRHSLRQHMYRVHNGSKPYVYCDYCDYKTVHNSNMLRHLALHYSKDEFTCEFCGKICSNAANLQDHITYNHVQTKKFKCDKCDKAFKRNSELVRHQQSHSDVRPHSCSLCGSSYKRLNHLKRHEQQAHKIVNKSRIINKSVANKKEATSKEETPKKEETSKIFILQNLTLNNLLDSAPSDSKSNFVNGESSKIESLFNEKEWGCDADLLSSDIYQIGNDS